MVHTRDGKLKTTLQNFHMIYWNSDISVNTFSIFAKSLENNVYCLPKRGISQNIDLGPGYFVIWCRIWKNYFFTIFVCFVS